MIKANISIVWAYQFKDKAIAFYNTDGKIVKIFKDICQRIETTSET